MHILISSVIALTLYGQVSNADCTVEARDGARRVCLIGGLMAEPQAQKFAKKLKRRTVVLSDLKFWHFNNGKNEGAECHHEFVVIQLQDDGQKWESFDSWEID